MIGGGEEIRRQGGEGKNRAPRKKRILSLSDLFLPRPVRPRSCHHELTIARYPIFASRALPAPILENDLLFKASLRALVSTPCRCTSFPPLLGKGANLRGSLFSSMECIHRWIERGTAGREPVACASVEITWNSFEFLQLGNGMMI